MIFIFRTLFVVSSCSLLSCLFTSEGSKMNDFPAGRPNRPISNETKVIKEQLGGLVREQIFSYYNYSVEFNNV